MQKKKIPLQLPGPSIGTQKLLFEVAAETTGQTSPRTEGYRTATTPELAYE